MSEQLTFDAQAAGEAATEGMNRASRADRVQLWKEQADAFLARMQPGEYLTADHLVLYVGLPDEGVAKNNVVGAWFSAKSKAGDLRFTGRFRKSERVIGHGNLQRIWQKQ